MRVKKKEKPKPTKKPESKLEEFKQWLEKKKGAKK